LLCCLIWQGFIGGAIFYQFSNAVKEYDEAVKRSEELKTIIANLKGHMSDMRSARLSRRSEINRVMGYRGTNQDHYDGNLYKYVSELRKTAEKIYKDAPDTYTNPVADSQISEMLRQLEEYYKLDR